MEVKQQNIGAFVIDNRTEAQTLAYIEKNAPLLEGHLLIFSHTVTPAVTAMCHTYKLCFQFGTCGFKKRGKGVVEVLPLVTQEEQSVPVLQIFRSIRSGETIESSGDIVIGGNINDGARISCAGTLTIFGTIRGDISCTGASMLLHAPQSGKVSFGGRVINDLLPVGSLLYIYEEEGHVAVKEVG